MRGWGKQLPHGGVEVREIHKIKEPLRAPAARRRGWEGSGVTVGTLSFFPHEAPNGLTADQEMNPGLQSPAQGTVMTTFAFLLCNPTHGQPFT